MRRNSKGFSLIELLIVVAIILIIAAIAIPDLLKSRQAANQASAVGSLRTINTSEVTYSSTYTIGYAPTLLDLGPPAAPPDNSLGANLLDSVLAAGVKSTYGFSYVINPATPVAAVACTATPTSAGTPATAPTTNTSYQVNASPIACPAPKGSAGNYYFTDQSGVIRQNNTNEPSAGDNPLAG
ncbi:MAG TPA: prepilin-type N-terminal cleavage/methylation domain-containing protein [Terriglobia bacterium]|nr:prepilin-type N-terminal cleavage/methylation domain-containing protein [Terriglobia bacterium]